ncbi:hypothetical protein N0V82_002566 [Gnomoniopsis sp. IMI 355080]|nr:hypothetical protein N0V82_002566 [Gnomoniopsis sp. IMI 355080]
MPSWSRKSSCHSSEWSNKSSDQSYSKSSAYNMNRALSIRNKKGSGESGSSGSSGPSHRVPFSFSSLRGSIQPELSRKLYKLIKTTNNLITAHETAGRERAAIASQLSEWGEQTEDEAISDVSDKVGVIMSEMGEQEDLYAHAVDDCRGVLKQIRDTEKSVQPSRDGKKKIADEIAKLKSKEPESTRLVTLEQELVRSEAENLVAEAQLTNIHIRYLTVVAEERQTDFKLQTREKLKEAYDAEFLATIERAEKQIILARHGRRLLQLLDDSPVVPGEEQRSYQHGAQARQILNDCEDDMKEWQPEDDDHLHGAISHGTGAAQSPLQSPTTSNIGGEHQTSTRQPAAVSNDGGEAVENTPTAAPQGEHKSVHQRGRKGDEGDSVSGVAVAPHGVTVSQMLNPC